jgi:hypothetical protein
MSTQSPNPQPDDDDMPPGIDFSGGVRGKFYDANAVFQLPVYLDEQLQGYLPAKE